MKSRQCIFCGARADTDDHIPPKNLFPKPKPSNLITVPSCRTCNSGFSKDDEYFRFVLVSHEFTSDVQSANRLVPLIDRSFARQQQRGFLEMVFRSVESVDAISAGRVYLGKKIPVCTGDLERTKSVIKRIVRGLYYVHQDDVLPHEALMGVATYKQLNRLLAEGDKQFTECVHTLMTRDPITIGDDVFSYWHVVSSHDRNTSSWILRFFKSIDFFCITGCKG